MKSFLLLLTVCFFAHANAQQTVKVPCIVDSSVDAKTYFDHWYYYINSKNEFVCDTTWKCGLFCSWGWSAPKIKKITCDSIPVPFEDSSPIYVTIPAHDTLVNGWCDSILSTKFGVLVNGKYTLDQRMSVARQLGVNYMRTQIILVDYDGSDKPFETYTANGFDIVLNLNWGHVQDLSGNKTPVPFPTDLDLYRKRIAAVLDKYKPVLVVCENEETNRQYHIGPMSDYIAELKICIEECHKRGILITNGGGFNSTILIPLIYRDYVNSGLTKEADAWALATGCAKKAALDPNNDRILQADTLLNAFKTLDLDFVNFHWYEPSNHRIGEDTVTTITGGGLEYRSAFEAAAAYLFKQTGKPVMNNEMGQDNYNASLTTSIIKAVKRSGIVYSIWFSGDGGDDPHTAEPLQDVNGNLLSTGKAYQEAIIQ